MLCRSVRDKLVDSYRTGSKFGSYYQILMYALEEDPTPLIIDLVMWNDDESSGSGVQVISGVVDEPSDEEDDPNIDLSSLPARTSLADTGCGRDLMSRSAAACMTTKRVNHIMFRTASGRVDADAAVPTFCKELGAAMNPYVLKSAPRVISLGKRCMEEGCTFLWPAGGTPLF